MLISPLSGLVLILCLVTASSQFGKRILEKTIKIDLFEKPPPAVVAPEVETRTLKEAEKTTSSGRKPKSKEYLQLKAALDQLESILSKNGTELDEIECRDRAAKLLKSLLKGGVEKEAEFPTETIYSVIAIILVWCGWTILHGGQNLKTAVDSQVDVSSLHNELEITQQLLSAEKYKVESLLSSLVEKRKQIEALEGEKHDLRLRAALSRFGSKGNVITGSSAINSRPLSGVAGLADDRVVSTSTAAGGTSSVEQPPRLLERQDSFSASFYQGVQGVFGALAVGATGRLVADAPAAASTDVSTSTAAATAAGTAAGNRSAQSVLVPGQKTPGILHYNEELWEGEDFDKSPGSSPPLGARGKASTLVEAPTATASRRSSIRDDGNSSSGNDHIQKSVGGAGKSDAFDLKFFTSSSIGST